MSNQKKIELVPVIIRYENETGEAVAFFPNTLDRYGNLDCYAHIGQHSAASYDYYLGKTKPAKYLKLGKAESLFQELCGIYESDGDCKLVLKQRINR